MSVTDYYQPTDFSDTEGPDCGQENHPPSCLCDVDLAAHPVPASKPFDFGTEVGSGRIATQAVGRPRTAAELVDWAAELLGNHDAMRGVGARLTLSVADIEEARAEYHGLRSRPLGRYGAQAPLRTLLTAGLTLTAVAAYLDEMPRTIVRQFAQQDTPDPTPAWVEAERLLRLETPWPDVAKATGLDADSVRRLATAIGQKSKRSQGGGLKYGPEQYEQILRLRSEGRTYGQISATTGVPYAAVTAIVRRRMRGIAA